MFVLRILARLVVFAIVATLAFSVVRAAAVGTWFHPGIALGVLAIFVLLRALRFARWRRHGYAYGHGCAGRGAWRGGWRRGGWQRDPGAVSL